MSGIDEKKPLLHKVGTKEKKGIDRMKNIGADNTNFAVATCRTCISDDVSLGRNCLGSSYPEAIS